MEVFETPPIRKCRRDPEATADSALDSIAAIIAVDFRR